MKIRLYLWMLCYLCAIGQVRAQQLEFLNSTLADALTAIDQRYPETRIHFVYNELENLRISAHLPQDLDAETAVRAIVGQHPVKITAYREHIFVEYLTQDKRNASQLLLPEPESPVVTILLNNVDVGHELPTIQLQHDQTTLQVAGSMLANVGTAFDLLSYLPGFSADDPSTVFFIDGLPISNLSQLTLLDSEQISRIEYSNNGGHLTRAGKRRVVNIITRLGQQRGIQARLHSQLSAGHDYSARQTAALDVHHRYFDLFTLADYEREGVHKQLRLNQQDRLENYASHAIDLSASFNVHLTDNHTLGFKYIYKDLLKDIVQSPEELIGSFDPDNLETFGSKVSDWRMHYSPRHDLNAFYRAHGQKWNLRMGANYYKDGISLSDYQHNFDETRHQRNDISNTLLAVMAEGEYKLGKGHVNVGGEYSYTYRRETFYQYDVALRSWRHRRQRRASILVSYGYQSGRWSGEAGLRGEHIRHFTTEQHLYPFLSASLSGRKGNLSVSYALHTFQPTYAQTNGYTHYNIEQLSVAGNPYLRNARQHQFSIQAQRGDFLLQADVMHVTDYIAQYIDTRYDNYFLSYQNIPKASTLDVSLLYTHDFGRWHTHATASLYAQWLRCEYPATGTRTFNNPVGTMLWHNQLQLPWQLVALLDFSASTSGHHGTVWQDHTEQLDLGLNKSLGPWTFQLRATDLLHTAHQYTISYGNGLTYDRHCYADRQRFTISVRYQFGSQHQHRTYQGIDAGKSERERMK